MNKLAHGGSYSGREDDEAAILAFCNIQKAAALPYTRQQVSETQEEPVAALAAATEMEDIDLAEAIAESERRHTDLDAARAPRKRRAVTHDDSDTPSKTSEAARPRKKAARASRTSTTQSGMTIAGSSRSTATQRSTKKTRRPTRSPAASRQPDEDATDPAPTANTFAGASVDAMEDGAAPPAPAQKKPPPIVIQWAGEYKEFQHKLEKVATSATVKNAGRDLYKVTVSSNEEHRAVMDAICKDGLPCYTHPSESAWSKAEVEEPREVEIVMSEGEDVRLRARETGTRVPGTPVPAGRGSAGITSSAAPPSAGTSMTTRPGARGSISTLASKLPQDHEMDCTPDLPAEDEPAQAPEASRDGKMHRRGDRSLSAAGRCEQGNTAASEFQLPPRKKQARLRGPRARYIRYQTLQGTGVTLDAASVATRRATAAAEYAR
ncbi:uncharacterized protein LOC124545572 [Schistocerca americana]|uniref:uncharacterized protein LOC124545572 n=1 Tax=Schistocerca americana TaxID=7009 RepID=UPI001F4FB982|nr:uncharacterized protein LOC124545572 [Schistocerca americana]